MGKTRDLFKKIRDTKGTFHAKMGSIKDRKGTDLTEAEDIKKKWQDTKHGKENVPWVLVCHGPQASVSVQDTGERTASGVLDSTSTAWVTSQC